MVYDISTVDVKPGQEEAFIRAFHAAWSRLGPVAGLERWSLLRGVEKVGRFVFLGEWRRLEDHRALAATPGYARLLADVGPLLAGSPEVLRYETAADASR